MSADRELLELAAKAVGLKYYAYVDSDIFGRGINIGEVDVPLWNPLTDDGDALRLAATLEMSLNLGQLGAVVYTRRGIPNIEELSENFMDATRRAIVRAAAEIGKATP